MYLSLSVKTNIYRYGNYAQRRGGGYDLSSGRHRDAGETTNVPWDWRWFKYLEARGWSVTLRYVTIIFFLPSRSKRIRFPAHLVSQPSSTFCAGSEGILSLRHREPNAALWRWITETVLFLPTLGDFFKNLRGAVTLIKPRVEYHCFSNLVIGPQLCRRKIDCLSGICKRNTIKYESTKNVILH